MRIWAALALCAAMAAAELPTFTRTGTAPLTYNLNATAPWMPLLWDRCDLTLPAGTTKCEVVASMQSGTGLACDGSDLLGLREGHRLTLDASNFTVEGTSGTWNGVCSTGETLTASINQAITADRLLLLCRQLHYANLGGTRTLVRRRVGITVRAFANSTWSESAMLTIDIDEASTNQPPVLRFDTFNVPLSGNVPFVPLGWYDDTQPAADLRWRLDAMPAPLTVRRMISGSSVDQTAELRSTDQTLDWFTAAGLRLHGGLTTADYTASVVVSDGFSSSTSTCDVRVALADGSQELQVAGDFPFAITGRTVVTFLSSRSDIRLSRCLAHPATGAMGEILHPFAAINLGQTVELTLDPALLPGLSEVAGCVEFTAGTSTFRLPYRIRLPGGVAN